MNITNIVAKNIKKIREELGLTLDTAANITGVSRSMLSQIEKGDTNPTISVLWKISEGYKIPFTSLISQEKNYIKIIRAKDLTPVLGNDENYKSYPIFPFDEEKHFETYYVSMLPDTEQISSAHIKGTEEYVTVFAGKLEVTVDNEKYVLDTGDSIRFNADIDHSYKNISDNETVFYNLIFYV